MDIQFWVRLIILVIYGTIAVSCVIALLKRPNQRIWAVVPLTVGLHVVAFYTAVLLHAPLSPTVLNQWSSATRVHEGLLILVGVWLFLWPARGNR